MARPKKEGLSPAVGTVKLGTKRGNPDFVSSSFYVPKKVNLRFDAALLTCKAAGYDLDRSDILSVLMDRFANAVKAAEVAAGDGEVQVDLESILATAAEGALSDSADVSVLKNQMRSSIAQLKADQQRQADEMNALLSKARDLSQAD